ncbi:MAG: PDDEXK nuclease domain-containing protein [Saprospiraceae bacterium]
MRRITHFILLIYPFFLAAQSGSDSFDYFKQSHHEIRLLSKNVNSKRSEVASHRYAKKLYFSRLPSPENPGRVFTQLEGNPALPFDLKPNDETQHIGFTALTNTGQRIYYTLYRQDEVGNIYRSQIWFHDKDFNGKWGPAKQLPRSFVDNGKNVKHPATGILSDTRSEVLFFISDTEVGKGKDDIWCTYLRKDGSFSDPLQFPFNTEEEEASPFFDIANQTLYFSSKGHQSSGGFDIFQSHYLGGGKWTKPESLGRPVNSYYDDLFFIFNENGHHCYFSSNRPGEDCPPADLTCRDFNIYQVNLQATLQVFLFDDQDKLPLYGCNVELKDLATGEILSTYLDLKDNFSTVGLEPGKEYQLIVSKLDYLPIFEDINADELDFFKTSFLELRLQPLKMQAMKVSHPVAPEEEPIVLKTERAQPEPSPAMAEAKPMDTAIIAYTELVEEDKAATSPKVEVSKDPQEEPVPEMPIFEQNFETEVKTPAPELVGKTIEREAPIEEVAAKKEITPMAAPELSEKESVAATTQPIEATALSERKPPIVPDPTEEEIVPEPTENTQPASSNDPSEPTVPTEETLDATTHYLRSAAALITSLDTENYLPVANMPQISLAKNEDPVDLLFFHKKLQCQIAFDFKNKDFRPDGTDTMNRYLTSIDGLLKKNQNPPIGITVFHGEASQFVVYSFRDANAGTAEPSFIHTFLFPEHYEGVLPAPGALIELLAKDN